MSPRFLKFLGNEWDTMKQSASCSFVTDNVKVPIAELPALGSSLSNCHRENLYLIAESVGGRAQPDTGEISLWETLEETWSSNFTFWARLKPRLPWWLSSKESACNAGYVGSIPGSWRSPRETNGNSLQYSCLQNPMDKGAWWATVHGVAVSQT